MNKPLEHALRVNPDWARLPLFDRKGWKRVRFGDVVENVNETERDPQAVGIERFIGLEHLEPGSLHIREWGNVAAGTTFTRRCRPGQVLFGKRRAYQRKVAVAEFDAVVSGDIYVLASKNNRLLQELLPFICLSERFFEHAVGTSAGSLSPRTNWSSLASFEFDLPPLDQQRRIAEAFWTVDDVRERWVEGAERTTAVRAAMIAHAIANHSAPLVRVGDVAKFTSGKSLAVSELPQSKSTANPIPVYGGNGISGFTNATLVQEKTIVIGRVGQFCGCVGVTSGPSWITDNALMAKWIDDRLDTDYLALCLEGMRLNQMKIGNYLPLVNQRVVHEVQVPALDRQTQLDFVSRVRMTERKLAELRGHIDAVNRIGIQLSEAVFG